MINVSSENRSFSLRIRQRDYEYVTPKKRRPRYPNSNIDVADNNDRDTQAVTKIRRARMR